MLAFLEDLKHRAQHSMLLRLGILAVLGLLLQAPIARIEATIGERQATREQAFQDVTSTWGGRQTLAGPLVIVPVVEHWRDENKAEHTLVRHASFLPESLVITGTARTEKRYRGIFEVPLYEAALAVSGTFRTPDFTGLAVDAAGIRWDQATLVIGLTDPKALRDQVSLVWDGIPLPFEPGEGDSALLKTGIRVVLPNMQAAKGATVHQFSMHMAYGGSGILALTPFGSTTDVELTSTWRDPSFTGAYLPTVHAITEGGFSAKWRVPYLGRGYPVKWLDEAVKEPAVSQSSFGVSFYAPVDAYTATTRAVKYELLFVFLTFMVFYLFEVFHRLRIHPVQYLLVGAALCLFYLLLLALAEHTGFGVAYLAASAAVVAVTGGYCLSILGRRLASIVGAELAGLYGFLYILLQVEDYALLVGAVGLFFVLAGVMYVTRHINWYRVAAPDDAGSPGPVPGTLDMHPS